MNNKISGVMAALRVEQSPKHICNPTAITCNDSLCPNSTQSLEIDARA